MKLLVLSLILGSGNWLGASTTFVGNGGDGYYIDGQVYLSDLYLGGRELSETPWFGDLRKGNIEDLLPAPRGQIVDFPYDLLVRKLSDMDEIYPGLGQMTAAAITMHTWLFVDGKLGPTCDQSESILDLQNASIEHVQIANRHEMEIRLHRDLWARMNDEHRVAVIVHEGVYSMLKTPAVRAPCSQAANLTRKIVRRLFMNNSDRHLTLDPEMIAALNVPAGLRVHFDPAFDFLPRMKFYVSVFGAGSKALHVEVGFAHREGRVKDGWFQAEIQSVCERLAVFATGKGAHTLVLSAIRYPFALRPFASGLQFLERDPWTEKTFAWTGSRRCRRGLYGHLGRWFPVQF